MTTATMRVPLTWQELEAEFLLREGNRHDRTETIAFFHGMFNAVLFRGGLGAITFCVVDGAEFFGRFTYPDPGEEFEPSITIDAESFVDWPTFADVLLHEMCHQQQRLVEGALDEAPHGPVFQRWATLCGLDTAGWDEEVAALSLPNPP